MTDDQREECLLAMQRLRNATFSGFEDNIVLVVYGPNRETEVLSTDETMQKDEHIRNFLYAVGGG